MSGKRWSDPLLKTGQWRVGINAHLLSETADYRRAGIHQYIFQVLRHLPRDEARLEYLVFTRRSEALAGQPGLRVIGSRWPTEKRLARILWEQMRWSALAAHYQVDLLHSMAFVTPLLSALPTVVTVYDLSFMHYPGQFPLLQRLYLSRQTAVSCRRARRVITISQSSRQDVHQFFGVPLDRIDVVLPGVDESFRPLPRAEVEAFRQRQGLPAQFLLHVGTLQPRKNIPTLLEALARLEQPDLCLVLVGGKGWLFDDIFARVVALGLQKQVRFTGYIPDEELPLWYNAAALLAFPSLYEGFGMPVVEAMACGVPVVASHVSSLPEAVGKAGLLFNPHDATELAERLAAVLRQPDLSAALREKGLRQAQRFSWGRAGQETAVAYRKALKTI